MIAIPTVCSRMPNKQIRHGDEMECGSQILAGTVHYQDLIDPWRGCRDESPFQPLHELTVHIHTHTSSHYCTVSIEAFRQPRPTSHANDVRPTVVAHFIDPEETFVLVCMYSMYLQVLYFLAYGKKVKPRRTWWTLSTLRTMQALRLCTVAVSVSAANFLFRHARAKIKHNGGFQRGLEGPWWAVSGPWKTGLVEIPYITHHVGLLQGRRRDGKRTYLVVHLDISSRIVREIFSVFWSPSPSESASRPPGCGSRGRRAKIVRLQTRDIGHGAPPHITSIPDRSLRRGSRATKKDDLSCEESFQ